MARAHRGPRAQGVYREVCRRVVLDANLVNYAPTYELDALRARGFLLSASLEGIREIWTRSINENAYQILANRIRKIADRLDAAEPIAFAGHALLTRVASGDPESSIKGTAFRHQIERGWRQICDGGLSKDEWERIGRELRTEVEEDERWWMGQLVDIRNLEARVASNERDGGFVYDRQRGWARIRNGMGRGAPVETKPPIDRRADAHLAYMIEKLKCALVGQGAGNDYFDARHLQHLAQPAFLATVDFRLIAAVDKTSRMQRAWVRAPVELIEDRISRSAPWGKPSAAIAEHFARGDMKALKARQDEWRRTNKRPQQ